MYWYDFYRIKITKILLKKNEINLSISIKFYSKVIICIFLHFKCKWYFFFKFSFINYFPAWLLFLKDKRMRQENETGNFYIALIRLLSKYYPAVQVIFFSFEELTGRINNSLLLICLISIIYIAAHTVSEENIASCDFYFNRWKG